MTQILIHIIYDNRKDNPHMHAGWGFSCLVEIGEQKILFDTGADEKAFLANLKQLKISLSEITDIFFSHKHSDHVAGLKEILSGMNKNVRLFLPKGFSPHPSWIQTTYLSDFTKVEADIYSLVLKGGFRLYEQSLILRASKGLVIITGCAHPGIVSLLENIKKRFQEPIHLVLGGFHLFRKNHKFIDKLVTQFRSLQVEKVAPCHCSGDKAIAAFQKIYQADFYNIGTGTTLTLTRQLCD